MKPTDKALTDLGFTFKSFWGWCWTNKHYMIIQAHKTWALWNAGCMRSLPRKSGSGKDARDFRAS